MAIQKLHRFGGKTGPVTIQHRCVDKRLQFQVTRCFEQPVTMGGKALMIQSRAKDGKGCHHFLLSCCDLVLNRLQAIVTNPCGSICLTRKKCEPLRPFPHNSGPVALPVNGSPSRMPRPSIASEASPGWASVFSVEIPACDALVAKPPRRE